jgi:hypothetical protein
MRFTTPDYISSCTGVMSSGSQGVDPVRFAHGLLARGFVREVYSFDDTSIAVSPAANGRTEGMGSVLCQVEITEGGMAGLINNVPVLTAAGGWYASEYWRPRGTTTTDTGATLDLGESGPSRTRLEVTDGDFVIIGFLGNDLARPIIIGHLMKSNSPNRITTSNVAAYQHVQHVQSSVRGVKTSGEVVIDTNAQADLTTPLDDKITLRSSGATVTIDGDGVTINGAAQGSNSTNQKGVVVTVGTGEVVDITGNLAVPLNSSETLMNETALSDIATVLTEFNLVIQAAAGMFGLTGSVANSLVIIPGLSSPTYGTDVHRVSHNTANYGKSITTTSLKSD